MWEPATGKAAATSLQPGQRPWDPCAPGHRAGLQQPRQEGPGQGCGRRRLLLTHLKRKNIFLALDRKEKNVSFYPFIFTQANRKCSVCICYPACHARLQMRLQYITERDLIKICNTKIISWHEMSWLPFFFWVMLRPFLFLCLFLDFSVILIADDLENVKMNWFFLLNKLLLSWEGLVNSFGRCKNAVNCIFQWINYSSGKRTPELSRSCSPTIKAWELFIIKKISYESQPYFLYCEEQ